MQLRSGAAWVAFARIEPFVTTILKGEFGSKESDWPDTIRSFSKDFWAGTFDNEIAKVSAILPGHYDLRSGEMTKAAISHSVTRNVHESS